MALWDGDFMVILGKMVGVDVVMEVVVKVIVVVAVDVVLVFLSFSGVFV